MICSCWRFLLQQSVINDCVDLLEDEFIQSNSILFVSLKNLNVIKKIKDCMQRLCIHQKKEHAYALKKYLQQHLCKYALQLLLLLVLSLNGFCAFCLQYMLIFLCT